MRQRDRRQTAKQPIYLQWYAMLSALIRAVRALYRRHITGTWLQRPADWLYLRLRPLTGLLNAYENTRIGQLTRIPYRATYVAGHFWRQFKPAFVWLLRSRESENFTYDLTAQNRAYLAHMLAVALQRKPREILQYIDELDHDAKLHAYFRDKARTLPRRWNVDSQARFGRRIGWYAAVRALKPKVVVETGVDKGLGALVLCAALRRNAEENQPGQYYGTDIRTTAGVLLDEPYSQMGLILYGDSIESLRQLNESVDLFINDSDHSADYEYREYQTIAPKLSPDALILGDNAHVSDSLARFSDLAGRRFIFFREDPHDHWYPGAGIGISFK